MLTVLSLYSSLQAQDYVVDIKQFDTSNGLLHRNVWCVTEDTNRFIWIGLENGLQRYDGVDFKNYSPENGFPSFYNARYLAVDDEGWLWVWNADKLEFTFIHTATEEVKSQKEKFGDKFPEFKTKGGDTKWVPKEILKNEKDGTLYFINGSPLQIISYHSKTGFTVHSRLEFEDMSEINFFRFRDGHLWAAIYGNRDRVVELGLDGEIFSETEIPGNGWAIYEGDTDEEAFFRRESKDPLLIYRFNFHTLKMEGQISDFRFQMYTGGNYVWIMKDTAWSVEKNNQQILSVNTDKYKRSLSHIHSIFEDSNHRLWFAGPWGLSRVLVKQTLFKKYFSFSDSQKDLYINAMRGILVHNDTLYAAVEYHGIAKAPLDAPDKMEVLDGDFHSRIHFYGARCLAMDETGTLITAYGGLLKWIKGKNIRTERIELKDNAGKGVLAFSPFGEIWTIMQDKGDIWLGASNGLWKRNRDGIYTRYILGDNSYNPIYFIKKEGTSLWIGADKGLYKLSEGKEQAVKQTFLSGSGEIPVYCMYAHTDGKRYFGTNRGIIFRDEEGVYSLFKNKRGEFSGNEVYGIYGDNKGNLWLSTNNGINRLHILTGETEVFRETDGISHNEFNRVSHYRDGRGNIYFGGLNGITAVNPNLDLIRKENDFKIYITFFEKHSGKKDTLENLITQVRKTGKIKYFPGDRFIRMRFAVPGLDNSSEVLYAWKITGLHNSWNYQKENILQFTNLPYGKHTLQIQGQTDTGTWTQPVEIEIEVIRPVVLRTWFLLVSVCVVLFIIIAVFRARTVYLKERQKELPREVERATAKIVKDKETIEKQAEELRKLDEVKTRFFTNITHELRTPLSLIKGPLSSVLKSKQLDEKNLSFLKTAGNNAEILQKLISSLLDLSKLESESMKINDMSFSLFEFTRLAASNFESYAQQVGIELIFDYKAAKSLYIKLDKEKLETIINNLISNAIKFTPEGGRITISVHDMENEIHIRVQDTGVGISAEEIPHIFERFYQASNTDKAQSGGTGIGLTLSIEFARLMGGDISVKSSPGEGSTFTVRLPRNEVLGSFEVADKNMQNSFNQHDTEFDHKKGAKILIVEDNESFSSYLATILSEYYPTVCAFNGKKAIEILENLEKPYLPDLILSDIMMPEMDGYQLLEYLKGHESYWEIPVIMLTARVALQDKLKALRTGVDDYITKPFEEEELLIRIANLLKHADNRTEEQEKEFHKLSIVDRNWLIGLEKYVGENCFNEKFNVNDISSHFAMSASSLLRKVKLLTGLTPVEYLREYKLNMGKELLETGKMQTVAEIAFAIGFSNPKSFSRSFKMRFGKNPSAYFSDSEQE